MKPLFKTVGVVGTGAMGRGIAQIAAQAGSSVKLFDVQLDASNKAKAELGSQWDKLVTKNRLDPAMAQDHKNRVLTVGTLAELADCDLVVEAVVERLDVNMHGIATSTRCSGAMPHEKSNRGMGLTRVDSAIMRCINAATASDAGSTMNINAIHAGQLAKLLKCRCGSPCVARAVKASTANVPSASANKYAVKRRDLTCDGDRE